MLPWGRLRDIPRSLNRASAVVVTKCPAGITPLEERLIIKQLNLYPYQNLFFTQMIEEEAYPLFEMTSPPVLPLLSNVIAMAGIGNPDAFTESLRKRFTVVGELIFRDHHPYRMRDLKHMERALENAPDNTFIVTTEKDAVKLTNAKRIPKQIRDRLYFISVRIGFAGSGEKEFLQKLYQYVESNQKDSLQYK
jgi:tetraacyldisaccharide 4'-kinase